MLTAITAVCIAWYQVAAHDRFRVIGKVDKATGYHIEYTVSSSFKSTTEGTYVSNDISHETQYLPLPPSPLAKWMREHLLHRGDVRPVSLAPTDMGIGVYTIRGKALAGMRFDSDGFVQLAVVQPGLHPVVERTLRSGCPMTLCMYEMNVPPVGKAQYRVWTSFLVIHPRNQPVAFIFNTVNDDSAVADATERELRAIRDTIKVVKAR